MGKHRRTLTERKTWTATTRKGTKRVRGTDVMKTIFGGYGGRISTAAAETRTYATRTRTGGKTTLTRYTRGAATKGGKVHNALVTSVYRKGARFHPVSYRIMPPGWRQR